MTKIIVTLGPSTNTFEHVSMIKSKGVDFVRINMSHSTLDDLKYYIELSKKANIPFIIDTEGSQVRTGNLSLESIIFKENDKIQLHKQEIIGNKNKISLRPQQIIDQLMDGDILYIDFDTLVLRISDVSTLSNGYINGTVISSGALGKNKGIVIDPLVPRKYDIPTLSKKDVEAIKIGLNNNIKYVAASFIRNGDAVKYVRNISYGKMEIISKIECMDALENLDEIIHESDFLLIDRGDLSKEIPIEKIPFTQKIILNRANKQNTNVFVATNLLESMITNRKPTRAEVHDIINTIVDGAYGLTMAAETAIGKNPIGCINMLNKIIHHSSLVINAEEIRNKEENFVKHLEKNNYLLEDSISSFIVKPHGGKLINRIAPNYSDNKNINSLEKIKLSNNQRLDLELIAIGAYSPLQGFMLKSELESVLNTLRLPNGILWPIPIVLDISIDESIKIKEGDTVALLGSLNKVIGVINVEEKYVFDKNIIAEKFYESDDLNHPGIKISNSLKPILLGGKITLFNLEHKEYSNYALTPRQTRRLFEEKNWTKVVGFHTRNVIHLAHEYIQLSALKKGNCDGIFIHPVVGSKKTGDYESEFIVKSYEMMLNSYYPDDKVVFGVFPAYSRYGGVKEALFTAICRKNYGCSHFIIGRDHTGTGGSVNNNKMDIILSQFQDIGMEIIKYDTVYYSRKQESYVESISEIDKSDKMSISGTEARDLLKSKTPPPEWFMRGEISEMIIDSIEKGEKVFVE